MLVLSRKVTESIRFPELDITVEILKTKGSSVRLGINAPIEINVLRGELTTDERNITKKLVVSAKDVHDQRNKMNMLSLAIGLTKKLLESRKYQAAATRLDEALEFLNDPELTLGSNPDVETAVAANEFARTGLLVEDVANEREMLAGFLRLHGFQVDTARDGMDAIEYLESYERPDFILMDMNLPRLHGTEAIRKIRQDTYFDPIPIFAISGSEPSNLDFDARENGVSKWFLKPVRPVELIQSIHGHFAHNLVA